MMECDFENSSAVIIVVSPCPAIVKSRWSRISSVVVSLNVFPARVILFSDMLCLRTYMIVLQGAPSAPQPSSSLPVSGSIKISALCKGMLSSNNIDKKSVSMAIKLFYGEMSGLSNSEKKMSRVIKDRISKRTRQYTISSCLLYFD